MRKTRDGRFIEKRVLISKEEIKFIIDSAKKNNNLTLNSLAARIGVSSQTIRHEWISLNRTIPLSLFNKIVILAGRSNLQDIIKRAKILKPFWGQSLEESKRTLKRVNLPERKSEDFAEFYGILLGDGCVFSNLNGLTITGDKFLDHF